MKKRVAIICLIFTMGIVTACRSVNGEQMEQTNETNVTAENLKSSVEESENIEESKSNLEELEEYLSDQKVYVNGDSVELVSGLKVTIIDSGVYSKANDFDNTVVDQYAFLEVDIENTGSEDIAITGSIFEFYADGYALKNVYLYEDEELPLACDLSPGRKVKGRIYAEGPEISSAGQIEAELGEAIIRVYKEGDYGVDSRDAEDGDLVLEDCLGTIYSIYDSDIMIDLYIDDGGKLCVWNGKGDTEEPYYTQTYIWYRIEDHVLYGYAEGATDEFDFCEDGIVKGEVEVLLSGSGSTHYQTYIQEEEYWNTNWREAFGLE